MKEVLTISVDITGFSGVQGNTGEALMIFFGGEANSEVFRGKILPGGIDTQKQWKGETRTLSARYVLEGTDCEGNSCKMFIENNGIIDEKGEMRTVPRILTDSKALAYLETAELSGTISPKENGVIIHIWMA